MESPQTMNELPTSEDRFRETRELMQALEASREQFKREEKARQDNEHLYQQQLLLVSGREAQNKNIEPSGHQELYLDSSDREFGASQAVRSQSDPSQQSLSPLRSPRRLQQRQQPAKEYKLPTTSEFNDERQFSPMNPPYYMLRQRNEGIEGPQQRQQPAKEYKLPTTSEFNDEQKSSPMNPPYYMLRPRSEGVGVIPNEQPNKQNNHYPNIPQLQRSHQPAQKVLQLPMNSPQSVQEPRTREPLKDSPRIQVSPKKASNARSINNSDSKLLLKMIKQEMVQSLMKCPEEDESNPESSGRGSTENSKHSHDSSLGSCSDDLNDGKASFQLEEVAEALVNTLATHLMSNDRATEDGKQTIRSGILELLSADEQVNHNNYLSSNSSLDFSELDLSQASEENPTISIADSSREAASQTQPCRDVADLRADHATSKIDELLQSYTDLSYSDSDDDLVDNHSTVSDITAFSGAEGWNRIVPSSRLKNGPIVIEDIPNIMSHIQEEPSEPRITETKRVQFGHVTVRHYQRILSDNPACSTGPGIGIGWAFKPNDPVPLDDWEKEQTLKHRKKRSNGCFMLSREKRINMMKKLGYTDKEIASTVRKIQKMRAHRRNTINNLSVQKMEEVAEVVGRKFKKMLRGK